MITGSQGRSQYSRRLIWSGFPLADTLCAEPQGPSFLSSSPLVVATHCCTTLLILSKNTLARCRTSWECLGMAIIPWGRQGSSSWRYLWGAGVEPGSVFPSPLRLSALLGCSQGLQELSQAPNRGFVPIPGQGNYCLNEDGCHRMPMQREDGQKHLSRSGVLWMLRVLSAWVRPAPHHP